jgi:glyoxylase-like metal-dependent hydrolase (beta-lactamase superfamily II)
MYWNRMGEITTKSNYQTQKWGYDIKEVGIAGFNQQFLEVGMNNIDLDQSPHFRLEQLSDGVYAAIHREAGWAISNAGIIDLGDHTLVFDTFMTPAAARDLRQAAENLTGRPVHAIINSHYHNDHIWGNQVFSEDVDIISTSKAREMILVDGAAEIQGYHDSAQQTLEALEAQYKNETDETQRSHLRIYIDYYQAIIATLPKLKIRPPNLTVTGSIVFEGFNRSAQLIAFEGGHCGSDAILFLPKDNIVFMADLLFTTGHPYLPDGDPDKIKDILAQVRQLHAKIFVPGHGPVGDASTLDWMDEYIDSLNAIINAAINKGATQEEIGLTGMPEEYKHLIFPNFFMANLKFLYQRQLASRAGLVL